MKKLFRIFTFVINNINDYFYERKRRKIIKFINNLQPYQKIDIVNILINKKMNYEN